MDPLNMLNYFSLMIQILFLIESENYGLGYKIGGG